MMNRLTPFISAAILFYIVICIAVHNQTIDIGWVNFAAVLAAIDYLAVHLFQDYMDPDGEWSQWDK